MIKEKCIRFLRECTNNFFQHIFHFDKWHIIPTEAKPYIVDIVSTIAAFLGGYDKPVVVEIGCGKGDVISAIQKNSKRGGAKFVGFDRDEPVLRYAHFLHKGIEFSQGSFDDVHLDSGITVFVMVNFIHTISPQMLAQYISGILGRTHVTLFVFDVLEHIDGTCYAYSHNGNDIFAGHSYRLLRQSGEYAASDGAKRHIEYWIENSENQSFSQQNTI